MAAKLSSQDPGDRRATAVPGRERFSNPSVWSWKERNSKFYLPLSSGLQRFGREDSGKDSCLSRASARFSRIPICALQSEWGLKYRVYLMHYQNLTGVPQV